MRRHAVSLVGALAFASTAALLALTPTGGDRGGTTSASRGDARPLLGVYAAQPSAESTFTLARLRVVSPAAADGPVRGYFGLPV